MFGDPETNVTQFQLEPGAKVADLGAGSGFYSIALARAVGETGHVFAVDVQKDLLEKLKKGATQSGLHNIEIIWSDLDKVGGTRLREATLDAVVASNLFFQLEHKDDLATEIKRILKANGKVLVVDWAESFGGMGPQPKDIVTKSAMSDLFLKHGFRFEREISPGAQHYGLIFRRQ